MLVEALRCSLPVFARKCLWVIPEITNTFDLNLKKKIVLESRFFVRNLSRALTEEIPESGRAPSRHLFFAHKKAIGRNDEKAAEFGGL